MSRGNRKFNRLKVVLAEQGRTSKWLSDKLKINRTTVSKWCTNSIQPTMKNLFAVADVLKIDVKELLISNKNK